MTCGHKEPIIDFELLPNYDFLVPRYSGIYTAEINFAACLTRMHRLTEYINDTKPKLIIKHNETIIIPLGLKCRFACGYTLQLRIAPTVGIKGLVMVNGIEIIDYNYRGELFVCVYNRCEKPITIEHGQLIAKGMLIQHIQADIKFHKTPDEEAVNL